MLEMDFPMAEAQLNYPISLGDELLPTLAILEPMFWVIAPYGIMASSETGCCQIVISQLRVEGEAMNRMSLWARAKLNQSRTLVFANFGYYNKIGVKDSANPADDYAPAGHGHRAFYIEVPR